MVAFGVLGQTFRIEAWTCGRACLVLRADPEQLLPMTGGVGHSDAIFHRSMLLGLQFIHVSLLKVLVCCWMLLLGHISD